MLNARTLQFSSLVSLVAAGALLGVACGSDKGSSPATSGAGSSTTTTNGGGPNGVGGAATVAGSTGAVMDPPKPGTISPESAGVMPLRRLTHREFTNTMAELLGDTTRPGSKFEAGGPVVGG